MLGTPNYKMPASIWMVPGGNRDQKRSLMKAQKYPMMSAIQKNLGGPLSEVFFSFLTPEQHDFIGYAPKLKGPGQDLWVAPSDILQNHVVMTRPHTSGLKQAMTHYGIMKLGKEVEDKVLDYYETEMKQFLKEMEKMLRAEFKVKVEEAVNEDRRYQNELRGKYIQEATTDLNKTFQKILSDTVVELLEESVQKLQEEVDCTKREMEEELCQAVNHRGDHLSRQFEFQLAWRENELFTKYQDSLRKLQHTFEERLDKVNTQRLNQMKAKEAEMAANHVTDLIIQAAERAKINHQERLELEHDFEDWFIKYLDDEVIKREYTIIDRENEIRSLKAKCEKWEYQMREVFKHFQRFINFALKEQPGQAEFMLSIEKELQGLTKAKSTEGDVELMAQTIIEFLIKTVAEKRQQETAFDLDEKLPETSLGGLCYKMQKKVLAQRVLKLEGKKNISTLNETRFKQIEKKSLVGMFRKNRSMVPMLASKNF